MTEAFETIKDSWATKRNAIIDCIVETEKYDGDLAMDMWLYILEKEGAFVRDDGTMSVFFSDDKMKNCIGDVFRAFLYKYEEYESPRLMCKMLFHHITPYIIQKERILEILFECSCNMGYSDIINNRYENKYIPALIACIILIDNPNASQKIVKYMINWTNSIKWQNMEDDNLGLISVGEMIRLSKEYIHEVLNNKDDFDVEYKITKRVKDALLSCVDKIEYSGNRAEFTIEVLSL
jgi:hypothetical protein